MKNTFKFALHFVMLAAFIASGLTFHSTARAGDFVEDQSSGSNNDSNFDPFSDYSEFEEGSEEESDVNFFHNGRFFSLGLLGGYQSFTDTLGALYKPSTSFGLFFSYFFDLKFAFQIAYLTGDHSIEILDARTSRSYLGKASLQRFEFDFKYYLNTQNVTRGLGAINPYLLLGVGNHTRTQSFDGASGFVRDTAFGFQGGAGIEVPFMKNKFFFGAQANYVYVNFPDEGAPITINGTATNITPNGDMWEVLGILGFSF